MKCNNCGLYQGKDYLFSELALCTDCLIEIYFKLFPKAPKCIWAMPNWKRKLGNEIEKYLLA